jgi:aminopeptidase-like protein
MAAASSQLFSVSSALAAQTPLTTGAGLMELVTELFPICRSLTGDGVRQTLEILGRHIPLQVHEVPSGTQMFDWTAPQEWNIRDAYIKNSRGERVVDFRRNNLHVMGYSVPVQARMSLAELRPKLHALPEQPDLIPFRTAYFRRDWAFSLSQQQLDAMKEDEYEVCIDSTLAEGHLTYGEYYLPGQSREEVLISTHVCHPSLANDNLSGIAIATALAQMLVGRSLRYSYRFLFIPAQVGSIAWLARNEATIPLIKHGLVLVALGDVGKSTYKKSRHGSAEIDRAVLNVLQHSGAPYEVLDFWPHGNDERQYSSPAFKLPVGSFMRTPCGRFVEYHTSADNLEFVVADALADSLRKCLGVISVLEGNQRYLNLNPKGEPQLGRRGLYRTVGDASGGGKVKELPILWVLNLSDGDHSLLDIAERAGMPFEDIRDAANALLACDLLAECRAERPESDRC